MLQRGVVQAVCPHRWQTRNDDDGMTIKAMQHRKHEKSLLVHYAINNAVLILHIVNGVTWKTLQLGIVTRTGSWLRNWKFKLAFCVPKLHLAMRDARVES